MYIYWIAYIGQRLAQHVLPTSHVFAISKPCGLVLRGRL